ATAHGIGNQHGFLLFSIETDCDLDDYTPLEGDCEDQDAGINPGIVDVCGDGIDLDCIPGDGTGEPWYGPACDGPDTDMCTEGIVACLEGAQGCTDETDHSAEVCSGRDDDCNGTVDDPECAYYDVDGDGVLGGAELAWVGRSFGLCSPDPTQEWWGAIDYTGDGCVDGNDLAVLANLWSRRCAGAIVSCD
ncbi:MAG: hypothetical protein R3344_05940, partial [Acidobacteriota bacterium]|nr:hypothetical protein [Acidobacteriota bacterium]